MDWLTRLCLIGITVAMLKLASFQLFMSLVPNSKTQNILTSEPRASSFSLWSSDNLCFSADSSPTCPKMGCQRSWRKGEHSLSDVTRQQTNASSSVIWWCNDLKRSSRTKRFSSLVISKSVPLWLPSFGASQPSSVGVRQRGGGKKWGMDWCPV